MKRSWKRTRIWKRLVSGLLTAVMLVTMLPTAAYAALLDNTPDQNRQILEELTAFWGDEKTAQEAMELLRQYGLIDEEGNILTDWSGEISIQEESRPLTIGEARAMSEGNVTVNGRACGLAELNAVLDGMERLGLLVDDVPAAHWQLQVDGQSVAPAELSAALEGWTAPEEIPEETPEETPEEIPDENPEETPVETPEEIPEETPEQSGGVLAALGRFFSVGAPTAAPAAPVVTVLGQEADNGELLDLIAFLDQYGLLTETGAASDWGLTMPGGERETDLTELLAMLESGDYDSDMVISVDGASITMADFKTMMDIQREVERIRDTYLKDQSLTPEQAGALYDLYQQLQENGIQLYDTRAADELEFPSGVNQALRVQVPESVTFARGSESAPNIALLSAKENDEQEITLSIVGGTGNEKVVFADDSATTSTVTLNAENPSASTTINHTGDGRWNGQQAYAIRYEAPGVIFQTTDGREAANAITIPVYVSSSDHFLTEDDLASLESWFISYGYGGNGGETALGEGSESLRDNGVLYYSIGGAQWLDDDGYLRNPSWPRYMKDGHNDFFIYRNFTELSRNAVLDGTITHVYASWDTSRADKGYNEDFTVDSIATEHNAGLSVVELNFSNKEDEKYEFTWDEKYNVEDKFKITDPVAFIDDGAGVEIRKHTVQSNDGSMMVRSKGIKFTDERDPTVVSVTAPAGSYYYNDLVPITVVFSEPVKSDGMRLTANGTELTPVSEGTGKTHTFLYHVPAAGNTFLDVTSIWGAEDVTGRTMSRNSTKYRVLPEGSLEAVSLLAAVPMPTNITVGDLTYTEAQGDIPAKTTATVEVTLDLPAKNYEDTVPDDELTEDQRINKALRNLILESYYDGENFNSATLAASMDGGETLLPLVFDDENSPTTMTATVELDAETLIDQQNFVMEFYHIDVEQNAEGGVEHITAGDLFFGRYAAFSAQEPVPLTASGIQVTQPTGWPTGPVYAGNTPEPETLKWSAIVSDGGYTWSQFTWYSDNPTVADIGADGQVIVLAPGTANFYVKAVNGGLYEDAAGTADEDLIYAKKVGSLTVQQGAMPYLQIPEQSITIQDGDPLTLRWSSNLVQKNAEFGNDTPTTFTITVRDPHGNAVGEPYSITYDPKDTSDPKLWIDGSPNQSYTITGLKTTVGDGKYTVTISAQAHEDVPSVGAADRIYTDETHVTVISKPVSVHLERPPRMFVTNGEGTLTIPYTLTDFDAENNAQFKLTVTNNATGNVVHESTETAADGGSFNLNLGEAVITDGFRTIYDVSLQAKNTNEPDWSRDSFTLYIYDQTALDILVQPMENGRVTVSEDGDTVTMSNEDWIATLSPDEIIALNRDIDLQTVISINYGDHAWGEASDRIRWASEQSGIAAVNYPQGAFYENIENLPYASYAPATQFLLSGKDDGTTVVEAIHALAGEALGSSVTVNVETLKDKLYLFQFYPAKGGLTMTYINGDGVEKTVNGDGQGRFAIYEENGIASDVYVKGTIDGDVYLGTVYRSKLVSQEKDAVSLELYPLNAVTLRKAATLPLYLLDEEGEPYNGTVTVRAGVYRNGEYAKGAMYNITSDGQATIPGNQDYTVNFTDGKATFYYDLTQFSTPSKPNADTQNPVTAADDIQFVLELRAGDSKTYYPILFTASGTTNEADAIRMAQRVITLEKVPEGQVNQPFVARQAAYFAGKESGPAVDLRGKNGKLGPSSDYPDLLLSTTVLWWGDPAGSARQRSIQYADSAGIVLQGQQVDNVSYPFCSMPVTHSTVPLGEAQLNHLGMGDLTIRTVTLRYIDEAGITAKQENMRWQLMNALKLDEASESDDLTAAMDALVEIMQSEGDMGNLSSGFLSLGLQLATSASVESDFLTLQLAPTQDPTVFRGLVYVGAGFGTDGITGADGPGNLIETMDVEDDSSYDLDYMPGLEDVVGVISGGLAGYGQEAKDEYNQAKSARKQLLSSGQRTPVTAGANGRPSTGGNKGSFGASMSLSGFFETEVYYDFNAKEWKMQLITGGFQAAGGVGYSWSSNFQVGPVPLFLELGVGLSTAVDFNVAVNHEEDLNDYLTQLQITAFIEAFAGFGFDYAVVALKLGIFGELSITAQLRWLNAASEIGKQFGHKLSLAGEVGVKAEVTVLFISYSAVLWSEEFGTDLGNSDNWDDIEDYWLEVGAGKSGAGSIIAPQRANLMAFDAATGTAIFSAEQDAALVDRDYLGQYERRYNSAGPGESASFFSLLSSVFSGGETSNSTVPTIESAYSYASPAITDDGGWLFYLDDMENSSDATVVRVSAAEKNSTGGYDVKQEAALDDDGYGDSGLKAAGDSTNPVAVWSRVMEKPAVTEPGQAITPDVQAAMMNSSDIMVAVRDGNSWKIQDLTATGNEDQQTSNGLADLSPVVAANGSNILVAWRQVASSDPVDLTKFDAKDYIYFRYSSDYGETWTDAQPIYNGTSGAVKGIEAAMLPDGTAAVAFTLQGDNHDSESGTYSQEIAYAIVGEPAQGEAEILADGSQTEYQVLRYVQMTDDENLDENPQLAAVSLDDKNDVFVLGWHSLSADGGSDIRLAAVDTNGNRITGFVDSLSSLIQNTGVAVSANFQFVQNAGSLEDLSILWSETVASEDGMEKNEPSRDALSALRFRVVDGKISVTSAQRLVEMAEYTAIDSFNAYVAVDGQIYSVLQGTYYDYDNPETIDVGGRAVLVAGDKTSVYTAVGSYTESLRVDSVIPDYPNIRSGMPIPVQIGVTNLGTEPMSEVTVAIGKTNKTFKANVDGFVAIAPGETRTLTVSYTVEVNENGQIVNPKYTVSGTIKDAPVSSTEQELILNIPDLGIADSEILKAAENGDRVLQFTLYNNSDAKLAGSNNEVQFRFYSDSECTQPIDNSYFEEDTLLDLLANGDEPLKNVNGDDLAKIDEGIYTLRYRFDLERYIQQPEDDNTTPFADKNGEVRDGGVTLYAKAWIQMDDGEMMEFNSGNNTASVTVESLLKQSGEKVTVESQLNQADSGTVVNVTVRNNSIVDSDSGNLIVTLFDAQGNKVGVQQSYQNSENDLVALTPEAIATKKFTFNQPGVRAEVTYGDVVLESNNAKITDLTFSGIPVTKEDFKEQADGSYAASAEVSQLSSTLANVVTESLKAEVTINGQPMELGGEAIDLSRGENVLRVVVTSEDGSETTTYILTVQNHYPSSGGGNTTYPVEAPDKTEHGTVTIKPNRAERGDTVTITAKPDEGYQVGKVTVTDKNGNTIKVTNKGDGVYTFTMPASAVSMDVTFVLETDEWVNPFVDVPADAWYYDAVRYVNENGLMAGTSSSTFEPDLTTTRGMIVTILYRLEGTPNIETENWGYPFQDVDANAWYATAVYWARMNGIVAGYSDELFGPNDTITREQMATILYRYAQYKGYDTTARADLSRFTDAAQVGSWAVDAIRWANAKGMINGTSDTTLSPKGSATRAQAAVILTRFCQNIAK